MFLEGKTMIVLISEKEEKELIEEYSKAIHRDH